MLARALYLDGEQCYGKMCMILYDVVQFCVDFDSVFLL